MASYEEIAELASDINTALGTTINPDALEHIIEIHLVEDFPDVPIQEVKEQVFNAILLSDALVAAQDGESIETIEAETAQTAEKLGVEG
jgi:hypothetical protein